MTDTDTKPKPPRRDRRATLVNKKPAKHRSTYYATKVEVIKRAINWSVNYTLLQFTSHSLAQLPTSSKTEQLIRARNKITLELKASIKEDFEAYKAATIRARSLNAANSPAELTATELLAKYKSTK